MTLEEFERLWLVEPQFLTGKANSFPLSGNNWTDQENGDVSNEDPLLINPCERDPRNHLEWVFEWDPQHKLWDAAFISASLSPRRVDGAEDSYAKASIAVYGLNRARLVRERMARIKEMQLLLGAVVDTMLDLVEAPVGGRFISGFPRGYKHTVTGLIWPSRQPIAPTPGWQELLKHGSSKSSQNTGCNDLHC